MSKKTVKTSFQLRGIVVAGAFIYIRSGSEEKNKEYAKKHIDSFLETKTFHDIVKENISNKVEITNIF